MKKSQKGFTIIEVALVLAVGALIFLVVFLAVPALQRNSRNDARRRDVSSVVEAISAFSSNNPGVTIASGEVYRDGAPLTGTSAGSGFNNYIDQLSNNITTVTVANASQSRPGAISLPALAANGADQIYVYVGVQCKDNNTLEDGPARAYAVVGVMENAGNYSYICQNAS